MAKRRGAEFWQKHLDAWYQSDLTQEAYCIRHGLSDKTFYGSVAKFEIARRLGILQGITQTAK